MLVLYVLGLPVIGLFMVSRFVGAQREEYARPKMQRA